MLDELKRGVQEGFACVKLRKRSKAPVDPDWTSAPVPSYSQVRRWWESGFNIGVRLGTPSRLRDGHYLHVIDVDIRDPDDPEGAFAEAAETLRKLFIGVNWRRFPTVQSGSGGKSRHVYFATQKPFRSRKLARSKDTIEIDGKKSRRWELELFGSGKQVAMPPSKHPSGGTYRWLIEPDWTLGIPLLDAEHIEDVLGTDDYEGDRDPESKEPVEDYDEERVRDMLDELVDLAESHEDWVRVGMAVHHQLGPEKGWPIFDHWSRRRGNYNRKGNWDQWKHFKRNHPNPRTLRSLIKEFRERQGSVEYEDVVRWFEEMDAEDELIGDVPEVEAEAKPNSDPFAKIPKHLLSIPGKLQLFVDYFQETTLHPHPQFAVQAAIALGSLICGRNHRTDVNNYTSLYLVSVGDSGSGKEYTRKAIADVLRAAGFLTQFMGPRRYSSESAIAGYLRDRPRHISILDELGRYLGTGRKGGSPLAAEVQDYLMELFGVIDSTMAIKAFSPRGMSKEQIENMRNSVIERPSLVLMAMTTPSTFYPVLSREDVTNGFINRFLIVESCVGRQPTQFKFGLHEKEVPPELIKWVQQTAFANASEDDFDIVDYAREAPEPILIPFAKPCRSMIREMEMEAVRKQEALESYGLKELFARTVEIAMRLSLIVAISDESDFVEPEHLAWARDYVFYYQSEMAEVFKAKLGRSKFAETAEELYAKLVAAGPKGMTEREFANRNVDFYNFTKAERAEVLSRLETDYGVVKSRRKGQRGPGTDVYFALNGRESSRSRKSIKEALPQAHLKEHEENRPLERLVDSSQPASQWVTSPSGRVETANAARSAG